MAALARLRPLLIVGLLVASPALRLPGLAQASSSSARLPTDLKRAAEAKGAFVGEVRVDLSTAPPSLEALIAQAAVILVGRATSNASFLTIDGSRVLTGFTVEASQVIKGPEMPTATFGVLFPGGKVRFESGATAQINVPGFPKPPNQELYVWFLKSSFDRTNVPSAVTLPVERFETVSGPLGLYRLDVRQVSPDGGTQSELARDLRRRKLSPAQFIEVVTQLAGRIMTGKSDRRRTQ